MLEGLPDGLRRTLGQAFAEKGAVQCGFCTPGFLMRTKVLLQEKPRPGRRELLEALKPKFCCCQVRVRSQLTLDYNIVK